MSGIAFFEQITCCCFGIFGKQDTVLVFFQAIIHCNQPSFIASLKYHKATASWSLSTSFLLRNCKGPLQNCWGFVDGTVRPISRPDQGQRVVHNGHKRVHAIKFQSVATPDRLVAFLHGPYKGKRHDSGIL